MAGFFKRTGEKTLKGVKRTVGWKEAVTGWGLMKGAAKQLDPRELKNKTARVETFQSAYKRLGLTEKTLQANYQNLFWQFWGVALIAFVGVLMMVAQCVNGRFGSLLPGLGFLAICAGLLFKSSFRAFQYRHRSLAPVQMWMKFPSEWAPMGWTLPPPPLKKTVSEGIASALEREARRERQALLQNKKNSGDSE